MYVKNTIYIHILLQIDPACVLNARVAFRLLYSSRNVYACQLQLIERANKLWGHADSLLPSLNMNNTVNNF